MRIFLTGANGFIGRHLVPLLKRHQLFLVEKEDVRLQSPNLSYSRGDLSDLAQWSSQVRDFSPEACIHLAWSDLPDYSLSKCMENFNTTVRLFGFLKDIGCKKIFSAGTCWEYGNLQGQVREKDLPSKMNLFASFKAAIRLVGEGLAANNGIDFIWGRLFFVYGPGQREQSLIPACYQAFKNKQVPKINNPSAINDFIYVSDAASAITALIEAPAISGVFNIGSGIPATVAKLCSLVAQGLKANGRLMQQPSSSNEKGFWADISLIHKSTGWKPQTSLQKGIEETIKQLEQKHGHP